MRHEILSWAFGFFTLPAMAVLVALLVIAGTIAIGGISQWFQIPDHFKWLSLSHAWAGGWLFVAMAILVGVGAWRII